MEALELKHLAPYLPYSLRISCETEGYEPEIKNMFTLSKANAVVATPDTNVYLLEDVKPILRPLSDLNKIENMFSLQEIVSDELCFKHDTLCFEFQKPVKALNVLCDPLEAIEYLYRNHYDIFGLIDKGLAIDINIIQQGRN